MNVGVATGVVILGGGIAGVTVATTLRDLDYRDAVTIVEASAGCTDHPPLSKRVIVSGIDRKDLDLLTTERADALGVQVLTGTAATRVDAAANAVHLADGRLLTAETIVVAVGAEANPLTGYEDDPRVVTLRGYSDAVAIRTNAGAHRTVLVVGGGFIGAEVAASLRELGTRVVLVDPHEVPGAHVFGVTLAGWLHAAHAENGVEVRRTRIGCLESDSPAGPVHAILADGSSVAADLVVVGVGVAAQLIPGAEMLTLPTGLAITPAHHWDAARLDGRDAAARLLGKPTTPRGAPWFWSDRYGHHIEVVGDMVTAGTTGEAADVIRPGSAVFRVDGDSLVGAASIDDPMTVRAARRIIDHRVRVDRDALADPSVSLRRMLRS